jgi:hypothetical protein
LYCSPGKYAGFGSMTRFDTCDFERPLVHQLLVAFIFVSPVCEAFISERYIRPEVILMQKRTTDPQWPLFNN